MNQKNDSEMGKNVLNERLLAPEAAGEGRSVGGWPRTSHKSSPRKLESIDAHISWISAPRLKPAGTGFAGMSGRAGNRALRLSPGPQPRVGCTVAGRLSVDVMKGLCLLPCSSKLMAVIFDCDGVLVDSEPLHYDAFQEVLRPIGLDHDYERYLERYIGFDDRDAFIQVFKDAQRPLDDSTLGGLMKAKGEALQVLISKGISGFPGTVELVRDLAARGIPLAVASGALRHEVGAFIAALGLSGSFQVIVAADDVSRSKPDPETYLKTLSHIKERPGLEDLLPGRCIAIEDTPTGIQSARGAGLFVIGVANSYPKDQLSRANFVVESLTDLDADRMIGLIESRGE
jgi:beta-phosphoglucomutase